MKKQRITIFLLILVALLVVFATVYAVWSIRQNQPVPAASAPVPPDAQAAIAGVAAFYTIDYTESMEDWINRVCATTTEDGCILISEYVAGMVYATADEYSIQTDCTVLPVELVDNDETNQVRVWKVQITLSNPWPTVEQTKVLYVAVEYDETLQVWRMQHILFEQETQKYAGTPTP